MRHYALVLSLSAVSACSSAGDPEALGQRTPQPPAVDGTYGAEVTAAVGPNDGAIAAHAPRTTPYFAPVMKTSFEPASAECNDWAAEGADAIRSVPPHSGTYACRICATGALPDIAIARAAGALQPGRYVLTAWLRGHPNRAAPRAASALLEADTAAGTMSASSPVAVGDDYARVQVTLDLASPATAIRVRIGAAASMDQCVLIDDVLVERVN